MYHGAEIANKTEQHQRFPNLTTTAQEAIGAATVLAGRKYLYLWNQAGQNVYWSFDPTLSGATVLTRATGVIEDGDQIVLPFGPFLTIYICTAAGQANVMVTEIA